jgi:type II secretion system protein H
MMKVQARNPQAEANPVAQVRTGRAKPLSAEFPGRRPGIGNSGRGFTLIELILVMAVLAVALAVAAPALSRFFKGRSLDSEARRFMSLTRQAQSRAVSEGVPMVLWLELKQRLYGLNADKSFIEDDTLAVQFNLEASLDVEVWTLSSAALAAQTNHFKNEKQTAVELHTLRFNPDGFVSPNSPEAVIFRQGNDDELWVVQSRNRLHYEIQTSQPAYLRR